MEFAHAPILLEQAVELLAPHDGGVYVDGTLGGGGHAQGILAACGPTGRLYGIDRDAAAIAAASARLAPFGERFCPIRGNFHDARALLAGQGVERVDGVMLDLGVSSYQLDAAERGFSYREDAALDMRMDQRQALSAYEVVNTYPRGELLRVLRDWGEEPFASRIASFIVQRRADKPILTTGELVRLVEDAVPMGARRQGHPAKRVFQAIRIEVNGELEPLQRALEDLIALLEPGGRICVLTFHSLEDRIVKRCFRTAVDPCICPKSAPQCVCGRKPIGKLAVRKPIVPSPEEIVKNPRAHSAKLRCLEKLPK
ncbi:MAG: 16S rRNA (cytosine(1402)-N(4))-methyltransferase RsmH [Christensenellales bacterium]|jgi:16S rRNA (cytosine1402-N4)-methyltransferase